MIVPLVVNEQARYGSKSNVVASPFTEIVKASTFPSKPVHPPPVLKKSAPVPPASRTPAFGNAARSSVQVQGFPIEHTRLPGAPENHQLPAPASSWVSQVCQA